MEFYIVNTKLFCLVVFAALTGTMLLASGCGSSDESADNGGVTVEAGSLSKAEFIKQVEAICRKDRKRFEAKLAQLSREKRGKPSTEAGVLVDRAVRPVYEREVDEISSLGAPKRDADDVAAILSTMQRTLEDAGDDPSRFVTGVQFSAPAKLAERYGLDGCAATWQGRA
jgi:hypothetical protein